MSDADRIANGADLIVKLAALGADPSGLSAAGVAASGFLNLRAVFGGGQQRAAEAYPWIREDLRAGLRAPDFHMPSEGPKLLPQMLEMAEPRAEALVAANRDPDRIVAAMLAALDGRDPAHAQPEIRAAFAAWVTPPLTRLMNDPEFCARQAPQISRAILDRLDSLTTDNATTHDMLRELLRRTGGPEAAIAQAKALSLDELRVLGAAFGAEPGQDKYALVVLLQKKAQELAGLKAQVEAIPESARHLHNLKAAARDALARLDLDEADRLLTVVHAADLDEARRSAELRADTALLRGRTKQARRMLAAAADTFRELDQKQRLSLRLDYANNLFRHAERFGGDGAAQAEKLLKPLIAAKMKKRQPRIWAIGTSTVGYCARLTGTRLPGQAGRRELGRAVTAHGDALTVLTEADHPLDWAATQTNLGAVLAEQGRRLDGAAGAAKLDAAAAAFGAALRVRTEAEHPLDWATTQTNLGAVLAEQGQRLDGAAGAAKLGEAAAAHGAALRVWTEAEHPLDWARTQNNLGAVHDEQGRRLHGAAGAARLEAAAAAYGAALRVRTEAEHPLDWAATQNNLGAVLDEQGRRLDGASGAAKLDAAAAAYSAALRVWTEAEHPLDWAATQNNLGVVLAEQGRRLDGAAGAARLEAAAAAAYGAALRVRTEADHPLDWAATQFNLAELEAARAARAECADPHGALKAVLGYAAAALRVFDAEHTPEQNARAVALRDHMKARLAALDEE